MTKVMVELDDKPPSVVLSEEKVPHHRDRSVKYTSGDLCRFLIWRGGISQGRFSGGTGDLIGYIR